MNPDFIVVDICCNEHQLLNSFGKRWKFFSRFLLFSVDHIDIYDIV